MNSADAAIAAAVRGRGITRVLSYMIGPQLEARTLELVLDDFVTRREITFCNEDAGAYSTNLTSERNSTPFTGSERDDEINAAALACTVTP